jgi:hypothetical protein
VSGGKLYSACAKGEHISAGKDLQRTESEAPASVRAALESAAVPVLLPLIPLVIERLRKHRDKTAKPTDAAT